MNVQVVDGEVVVLGPDGFAVALTPEAARTSGERLLSAAGQAKTQPPGAKDST